MYGRAKVYFRDRNALITAKEILQQPALWRVLSQLMIDQSEQIDSFSNHLGSFGKLRIIFSGAGSSAFIGESLQMILARSMGLRSDVIPTTDIVASPESVLFDIPTLMVSFSRSGESPESIAAILFAEKQVRQLYHLIAVCKKGSSLASLAKETGETLLLDMPEGSSDLGFAMTSSISCMILGVYMVLSQINKMTGMTFIHELADSVEKEFLSMNQLAQNIAEYDYNRIVFLGSGGLKGLAHEGAIKSLELTNGIVNAMYESPMGFRHGPKTVVNDATLTVHFISPFDTTQKYDIDLLKELILQKHRNRQVVIAPIGCRLPHGVDYCFYYDPVSLEHKEISAYIKCLLFLQVLSLEKSMQTNTPTDNPSTGGEVNRIVQGVTIY